LQTEQLLNRESQADRSSAEVYPSQRQPDVLAKGNWSGSHPINIRLTVPLLFTRAYITVVAGSERRSAERRRAEKRLHPLLKLGNVLLFLIFGSLVGLAILGVLQIVSFWVLV
jgi:hypothetical protein